MKRMRARGEDLAELLRVQKIGDEPIYDVVNAVEIIKVPGGYLYSKEYVGLTFVPDAPIERAAERHAERVEDKIRTKPGRKVIVK